MSVLCIDGATSGVFRTSQKIGTAIRIRAEEKVDDASQVPAHAHQAAGRHIQDTWLKCEAVSDKHSKYLEETVMKRLSNGFRVSGPMAG